MNCAKTERQKALVAFFIGALMIIFGAQNLYRWGGRLIHATGIVQKVTASFYRHNRYTYSLEVDYQDADQQTRHITILDPRKRYRKVGATVRFVYRPAHPDRGQIDTLEDRYLFPLGWLFLGFCLLGKGVAWWKRGRLG
jgi:hypothetical protein